MYLFASLQTLKMCACLPSHLILKNILHVVASLHSSQTKNETKYCVPSKIMSGKRFFPVVSCNNHTLHPASPYNMPGF